MSDHKFKSTTVVGQGSSRPSTSTLPSGVSAPGKAEGQADDSQGGVTLRGAHLRPAVARNTRQAPLWGGSDWWHGMFGSRWPGGRDPREMAS